MVEWFSYVLTLMMYALEKANYTKLHIFKMNTELDGITEWVSLDLESNLTGNLASQALCLRYERPQLRLESMTLHETDKV